MRHSAAKPSALLFLLAALATLLTGCSPIIIPDSPTDFLGDTSDPIIGKWNWFNANVKTFRSDGTMYTNYGDGQRGLWRHLSKGSPGYVLNWSDGKFIDTVTLQGCTITGINNYGVKITGNKTSGPGTSSPNPPSGGSSPPGTVMLYDVEIHMPDGWRTVTGITWAEVQQLANAAKLYTTDGNVLHVLRHYPGKPSYGPFPNKAG